MDNEFPSDLIKGLEHAYNVDISRHILHVTDKNDDDWRILVYLEGTKWCCLIRFDTSDPKQIIFENVAKENLKQVVDFLLVLYGQYK